MFDRLHASWFVIIPSKDFACSESSQIESYSCEFEAVFQLHNKFLNVRALDTRQVRNTGRVINIPVLLEQNV
jgi:hypothetical protein